HQFIVEYDPADLGATGPPPSDDDGLKTILGQSLLDRAGLDRRRKPDPSRRYDPSNNAAGQINDPNKPL
ncbi:MAG: hypothetical protein HOB20_15770, partial [Planctomycetaceae bacterium]|nr:hypothetical protein [Planctomycetaceae bacterium]